MSRRHAPGADTPGSRTLCKDLGVAVTWFRVALYSDKTKRGFLTPTRTQPRLGLVVRCGDLTL